MMSLLLGPALFLSCCAAATAQEGGRDVILKVDNPDQKNLPTLGVWKRDKEILVSAEFPNVPGFICDSWCYESPVEFLGAKPLGNGRLELRHQVEQEPRYLIITEVIPEPGALEFIARAEVAPETRAELPGFLLAPNLCWQLTRAETFRSRPDLYPEFVKRCFIFTERGLTFLHNTERMKIPCRKPDDEYNTPPWVQMHVGMWQNIPYAGPTSWADYSPDRYTMTVIGAVSRDAKHMAVLANDTADLMCQAWHDCMHNNANWAPADAPPMERRWRVKIYAGGNDTNAMLEKVSKDFPGIQRLDKPGKSDGGLQFEDARLRQPGPAFDYQKPGIKDSLPAFRDEAAARLTYPMSWLSGNFNDFAAWRKIARGKAIECLLAPPPPAPFAPNIVAEEDRGTYVARKVVFNVSRDSRVLAYMLVPKGSGQFPAVLLLHDHGARFDIGKEKVIRPFNDNAKRVASSLQWVNECYGGRYLGDELAKMGYVCFCMDALNWSDRGGAGYDGQQALAGNLFHLGMSHAGLIAHEDMRAAEFLATRPEVDPKRVAAMGLSMGCFRTWQVSALSDRISAGVAICWMNTIKGLMVAGNNQTRGQSAFTMAHPGLYNHLDYPDVASLACPKPMLFYNGLKDTLFPVAGVEDAYAKMRKVWESQGTGDRLATKFWDVPHCFNREMQDEAFAWLNRQMGVEK